MKHIEKLNIQFNEQNVGTLHLAERGKIYFSYSEQWLKNGFNLSPFDLKMDLSLQAPKDNLFSGLHGVFADSISDGWGLMLTDRALQKKFNWEKREINQLDRLFFIGARAMGGLEYFPHDNINDNTSTNFEIESIFEETQKIISGEKEDIVKELYLSGGSPGGARPKAVFSRNKEHFVSGYNKIPSNYSGWIIKFFLEDDSKSIGKIEKAYSDMAKDCGIYMPETDLIHVKIKNKSYSFFAIERFDRKNEKRIHCVSLSGLTYASHRLPSVSYEDIYLVTNQLCNNRKEINKLTDIMLFNIICHNKDDHSKNFSFQYINNAWQLTPSYDLVYSSSLANEHMSDVGGNGNPNYNDIKNLTNKFDINNMNEKMEQIIEVANNWKKYPDKYDIPKTEVNSINNALQTIILKLNKQKTLKVKI